MATIPTVRPAPRASDIRIDYVQHALCAWLSYEKFLVRSAQQFPRATR
jgi:hypothetical protein